MFYHKLPFLVSTKESFYFIRLVRVRIGTSSWSAAESPVSGSNNIYILKIFGSVYEVYTHCAPRVWLCGLVVEEVAENLKVKT